MRAFLIHGMGRTSLTMLPMAMRLRAAGIETIIFDYTFHFRDYERCQRRLIAFLDHHSGDEPYIIVGHSLGGVLARAALSTTARQPAALFLLAVPACACRAARYFAPRWWFRLITGTTGQLLADENFMQALPVPTVVTKIYAGNKGLRGRWSPWGDTPNDWVVTVAETEIPGVPMQIVPCMHSYIMNSKNIAVDIIHYAKGISAVRG